ncbi:GNAT family N-acetyltransferase [Nocardioides sp.]|uniref:GNAT family N-acetyltransferase n=1 Tax=Nocardioides sp. TaxID=35761 RepID=UPI002718EBE3|nr:GNAT family protein [Nocardioides sp.]MDO9458248.1 GNAT family protein [Nocardioides sp.]
MPEENAHGQRVGDVVVGWTPRPWPTPVRLEGRYVVLEPLDAAHAPALHRALCSPDDHALWTYRPTEPPADVPAMEGLIEATLAAPVMETWAVVAVGGPDGGEPGGITSFMRIEPGTGQVEVASVLYGRHLQRTPATTEATHLLMRWAFDELGYRRFEWKCDALNEPSRRAAARLGFTYEGRFRHHMITKGRNRDTDWFSVTDAEWPAVRAAHEAWLDPANFDAEGRQRSPLRVVT